MGRRRRLSSLLVPLMTPSHVLNCVTYGEERFQKGTPKHRTSKTDAIFDKAWVRACYTEKKEARSIAQTCVTNLSEAQPSATMPAPVESVKSAGTIVMTVQTFAFIRVKISFTITNMHEKGLTGEMYLTKSGDAAIKVMRAIQGLVIDRDSKMNESHESPWARDALALDNELEFSDDSDEMTTAAEDVSDVVGDIPALLKLGNVKMISRLTEDEKTGLVAMQ